ncbi:TMEM175 family protein [Thermodesulfobacteriota bacterium]
MKQQWFKAGRLGGISDGVFAIAMTLLVLELKLPELQEPVSREVFNKALLGQSPHFISWILSFAILCRLWITQHALLEYGDKKSRGFTTMNFVFLGAISFIPFPTSLISEHYDHPLSIIIFSVTLFIAGLAFVGMWRLLEKEGLDPDKLSEMNRRVRTVIVLILVIAVISCLLATLKPQLGVFVWIVFPFAGLTMKRKRVRQEKI